MKSKYKNNTSFSVVIPTGKLYFSIGEVAEILNINASTIRFWEDELGLEIQKNSRNDRRFIHADIENLQVIMHLKEKGLSIEGIKTELKNNKIELKQRLQAIKSLNNIRNFFILLKNELEDDKQQEDYSFENLEQKLEQKNIQKANHKNIQKENQDLTLQSSPKINDENEEQMYDAEYLEEYQRDLVMENTEENNEEL